MCRHTGKELARPTWANNSHDGSDLRVVAKLSLDYESALTTNLHFYRAVTLQQQ